MTFRMLRPLLGGRTYRDLDKVIGPDPLLECLPDLFGCHPEILPGRAHGFIQRQVLQRPGEKHSRYGVGALLGQRYLPYQKRFCPLSTMIGQ